MPRRFSIGGDNHPFHAEMTDLGAGFLHLTPTGESKPITRRPPPLDKMESGRQGGGFWTIGQFARAQDRTICWRGEVYEIPWIQEDREGEKHALHGSEPWLVYDVLHADNESIHFRLDAEKLPGGYPFPHHSELVITIGEGGLEMAATIENTGEIDQPANPAWHPFYHYWRNDKPMSLRAETSHRFDYDGDPSRLELPHATSAPVELTPRDGYQLWRPLKGSEDYSYRYDGSVTFGWPGLQFRAESTCRHLQLWSVQRDVKPFGVCAVEPTAGPANGPWLASHGHIEESELFVVRPGERKSHTVRILRVADE